MQRQRIMRWALMVVPIVLAGLGCSENTAPPDASLGVTTGGLPNIKGFYTVTKSTCPFATVKGTMTVDQTEEKLVLHRGRLMEVAVITGGSSSASTSARGSGTVLLPPSTAPVESTLLSTASESTPSGGPVEEQGRLQGFAQVAESFTATGTIDKGGALALRITERTSSTETTYDCGGNYSGTGATVNCEATNASCVVSVAKETSTGDASGDSASTTTVTN